MRHSRHEFRLPVEWWTSAGERLDLGLPPERALFSRSRQQKGQAVSGLARVRNGLAQGNRLSEALRHSGLQLPVHLWAILEAGERTGLTGASFREVGEHLTQLQLQRQRLVSQLWYPGLVFLTAVLVMGIIVFWVVPRLRELGREMGAGAQLPWWTENLGRIYGTGFMIALGLLLMGIFIPFVLGRGGARSLRLSRWTERGYSAIPLLGTYRSRLREARLLEQLSVLLHGGFTLPEALRLVVKGTDLLHEKTELDRLRERLLMGGGFEAALRDCPLLFPETVELLEVGQECGKLDQYMRRIAKAHGTFLATLRERSFRLLEPAFLCFLTLAVGGLIVAYLLPIIRLLEESGLGA